MSQLNEQRASIDTGRDELEDERKEIAEQRHRDPIIASSIETIGLILVCLLPLLVCVYVLRQMNRSDPDDAAVAELLTLELVCDQPKLLSGSVLRPEIEHREVRGQESDSQSDDKTADSEQHS